MRLICPNCDAQYEVPDEVIPQDGRDVQCSNCGVTWFQAHPEHEQATEKEPEQSEQEIVAETTSAEPEPVSDPVAAPEETPEPVPEEPRDKPEKSQDEPKSRDIDPAVANILQQEAEHEAQLREAEKSTGLETQPDLGLQEAEDDASRRSREARERMARMRGESDDPSDAAEAAAAAAVGSRRDLLPDIEEINSTLRSTSDRQTDGDEDGGFAEPEYVREKRGFRRGFSLMILLAVILVAVYVFAPKIAQSVPQADAALTRYVALVDQSRANLDVRVKSMLEWLDAKASDQQD